MSRSPTSESSPEPDTEYRISEGDYAAALRMQVSLATFRDRLRHVRDYADKIRQQRHRMRSDRTTDVRSLMANRDPLLLLSTSAEEASLMAESAFETLIVNGELDHQSLDELADELK